jgi:hypothetical protein
VFKSLSFCLGAAQGWWITDNANGAVVINTVFLHFICSPLFCRRKLRRLSACPLRVIANDALHITGTF